MRLVSFSFAEKHTGKLRKGSGVHFANPKMSFPDMTTEFTSAHLQNEIIVGITNANTN